MTGSILDEILDILFDSDGGLLKVIFVAIISVAIFRSPKSKKGKQQKAQTTAARNAADGKPNTAPRPAKAKAAVKQPAAAKQAAAPKPAKAKDHAPEPHVSTLTPQVHVTRHTDDIFEGSMAFESGEGFDPCHEDALQPAVNPCEAAPIPAAPAASGGLALQWNADSLVKAVVMQEILTRPCDRTRR